MSAPWLDDGDVQLFAGNAADVLRSLPEGIAQTCVTSPPYWGLRDYGTGTWTGGDADCDHQPDAAKIDRAYVASSTLGGGKENQRFAGSSIHTPRTECGRCGARRVDDQLGLEASPDLYVERLVAVLREVWRVLRADGTLFLNLGDSYAGGGRGGHDGGTLVGTPPQGAGNGYSRAPLAGLKQKDLVGVPWRVAFALQADGWVLRSDVVWSKPNPMPESVTDRPTKAHEMVFLFAKAKWSGPERGRYAHISDEDARWLALLFDTEGNIVIKRAESNGRVQYGAQMAFANCSRRLLERARDIVGAGSLHERSGKNAPVFYWQMTGQQARDLLHQIYPWLIVKQRQARVAIHMQDVVAQPHRRPGGYRTDDHSAFLERCWQTVGALNKFGDPDISWTAEPAFGGWKSCERYFYDADAIREAQQGDGRTRGHVTTLERAAATGRADGGRVAQDNGSRNARSVWEIATQPTPEAHFATFPEALARRCILAGTSERGECSACGAPWQRQTSTEYVKSPVHGAGSVVGRHYETGANGYDGAGMPRLNKEVTTTGWAASCACGAPPTPQTVLDPFIGSGTTALVARKHGRRAIGIDLSSEYLAIAARRTAQLSLLGEGAAGEAV